MVFNIYEVRAGYSATEFPQKNKLSIAPPTVNFKMYKEGGVKMKKVAIL